MDTFITFISLTFICAGLGIDNGLLIEFSLKTLGLEKKRHLFWRSVTLVVAAVIRVIFIFALAQFTFLLKPLPQWGWLPNRWFSEHPEELTWMSFVLFLGGAIIIFMAIWEYYHKIREAHAGAGHTAISSEERSAGKILAVGGYLFLMNILFSLDSVFSAVAVMNLDTEFWWMVAAILIASVIMIVGMIPISAIISKNPHFSVLMLTILSVIASKLLVDGTGGHFSNGLLMFIIALLLVNDGLQGALDWASQRGERRQVITS